LALFFDYGQRAAEAERRAGGAIAARLQIPFQEISLPWLAPLGHSALIDTDQSLPELTEEELDNVAVTMKSAQTVWVPNRNGIFLNVAAAYAESLEADFVVTGFNAEEAMTFPDNSEAFVVAAGEFFRYSTLNRVQVISYTQEWNKTVIVQKGLEMDVPFDLIWSCYQTGSQHCGQCESCLRSIRAYKEAGIWERIREYYAHPIH
jgi:7-cyano-7-deazaguanine synthase